MTGMPHTIRTHFQDCRHSPQAVIDKMDTLNTCQGNGFDLRKKNIDLELVLKNTNS